MHLTQIFFFFLTQNQLVYLMQRLILLFISPGASPSSVTLSSCAPIRLIISPSRAVLPVNSHPLLPSLCLLVLFLLGIFQLGDFRSKLRQLSGLCTRAHRMERELGVFLVWVIVLFFYRHTCVDGNVACSDVCTRGEMCTCKMMR